MLRGYVLIALGFHSLVEAFHDTSLLVDEGLDLLQGRAHLVLVEFDLAQGVFEET
jgi:hypothetical protein